MEITTSVAQLNEAVGKIKNEIGKVIVGQEQMIDLLIAALLADGHVLIEGVPGVAKTLTAKLLARCIDVPFSRIQFTPDLMPSDVIGTSIFNPQTATFSFKHGPIFSNVVLIDEINRSPAKTQAALFEVMEERQITYDGITYKLPQPFIVLATQNPVEHEGTYRLPEAQLDRFLFKIEVGYPSPEDEVKILEHAHKGLTTHFTEAVQHVLSGDDIIQYREAVSNIHIEAKVMKYIAELVYETRNNKSIFLGGSPRASVAVLRSAKAIAAINGRDFVTPDDVIKVLHPVLCHRIILTPEREMEGGTAADVIRDITKKIEVPR
ncbi:MoxR family ATPase [Panacibacter ginsenosidivorans]|uniref:MoxR family ATPase n=1 Tax=Panacibacter ginsenosidivorans TaxID=1813871 RepID=A0A5B8V4W2_9BACT|nr:MoxR family ATPase [Panacibacter ginsenosidivorans]QEC66242.1 MoxR family ATPase [Panacibacter ginsenosidivorans]